MAIRTRFAPSPTGFIHVGNLRSAIFTYLIAKKENGTFVLRIEDTDMSRSYVEYTNFLIEDLHWLGIVWQHIVRSRLDIATTVVEWRLLFHRG